ncbi:MAG: hypothetical protein JSS75_05945 [Bacteroidetes bacterium]|nr:hypothetical protein [Bacteroidota bacterium]
MFQDLSRFFKPLKTQSQSKITAAAESFSSALIRSASQDDVTLCVQLFDAFSRIYRETGYSPFFKYFPRTLYLTMQSAVQNRTTDFCLRMIFGFRQILLESLTRRDPRMLFELRDIPSWFVKNANPYPEFVQFVPDVLSLHLKECVGLFEPNGYRQLTNDRFGPIQESDYELSQTILQMMLDMAKACLELNNPRGLLKVANRVEIIKTANSDEEIAKRINATISGFNQRLPSENERIEFALLDADVIQTYWLASLCKNILWSWLCYHYLEDSEFGSTFEAATVAEMHQILFYQNQGSMANEMIRLLYLFNQNEGLFDLNDWVWKSRVSREMVTEMYPSASSWLIIGSLLRMMRLPAVVNSNPEQFMNLPTYEYIYMYAAPAIAKIRASPERWFPIVLGSASDPMSLETRVEALDSLFQKLITRYKTSLSRAVVNEPISPQKLAHFIQDTGTHWEDMSSIESVFEHFSRTSDVPRQEKPLPQIVGVARINGVGRRMFSDNYGIAMFSSQPAYDLAIRVDHAFVGACQQYKEHLVVDSLEQVTTKLIEKVATLRASKHVPSLIMMNLIDLSQNLSYLEDAGMEVSFSGDNIGINPIYGYYEEIPIVGIRGPVLVGQFLVADFVAAFMMNRNLVDGGYKDRLEVKIIETSEEAARTSVEKLPSFESMSKEEAESEILKERQAIVIELSEYVKFQVLDPAAMSFCEWTYADQ